VIVGILAKPIQPAVPGMVMQRQYPRLASGTSIDSQGHAQVQRDHRHAALIETHPLECAAEAYDRMMSGKAPLRVVLETGA
jgi:D-arabinose 1-dehydrogenase-like Zn-dependent alcohol dehydrogenase